MTKMASDNVKTVLVIDDDLPIARLIKRILEKYGHTAIVCGSSFEALAAAKGTNPELIISDFNLPGYCDGVDLCTQIRALSDSNIPVIIMSGHAENKIKAWERGFQFMDKPLAPEDLLMRVEACLSYS